MSEAVIALSRAVRCDSSGELWKIQAGLRSGPSPAAQMRTKPDWGVSSPDTSPNSVDLPLPEGPMIATVTVPANVWVSLEKSGRPGTE
jgi:hypothetical protein